MFRNLFDEYRSVILRSRLLMVEGKLQKEGEVTHVIVHHLYNLSHLLQGMTASEDEQDALLTTARPDEKDGKLPAHDSCSRKPKPVQIELFPDGRNFR